MNKYFSKCNNDKCGFRYTCYRFTCVASKYQSYCCFEPDVIKKSCKYYINNYEDK